MGKRASRAKRRRQGAQHRRRRDERNTTLGSSPANGSEQLRAEQSERTPRHRPAFAITEHTRQTLIPLVWRPPPPPWKAFPMTVIVGPILDALGLRAKPRTGSGTSATSRPLRDRAREIAHSPELRTRSWATPATELRKHQPPSWRTSTTTVRPGSAPSSGYNATRPTAPGRSPPPTRTSPRTPPGGGTSASRPTASATAPTSSSPASASSNAAHKPASPPSPSCPATSTTTGARTNATHSTLSPARSLGRCAASCPEHHRHHRPSRFQVHDLKATRAPATGWPGRRRRRAHPSQHQDRRANGVRRRRQATRTRCGSGPARSSASAGRPVRPR